MRRLEAVLFLAREPLSTRKLAELASLDDGTQARTLVRRLNEHYDQRSRAFHVKQIADGYLLMTRSPFAPWLRRLRGQNLTKASFSQPALETLTVVAYRQPIIKADIEAIRGVNCSDILRQLLEMNLVRISGRSTELGRPFLYSTTRHFLRTFGLSSLDSLPQASQLRGTGLPTWLNEKHPLESSRVQSSSIADNPEDLTVRLSSPLPVPDELTSSLFGSTLVDAPIPMATKLDVVNAEDEEEDWEDEDDEDDFDDDEDDFDDEGDDDDEDDFSDEEWEEVEDDEEDWEDDEDEEDDWDDDFDDEDDDWE